MGTKLQKVPVLAQPACLDISLQNMQLPSTLHRYGPSLYVKAYEDFYLVLKVTSKQPGTSWGDKRIAYSLYSVHFQYINKETGRTRVAPFMRMPCCMEVCPCINPVTTFFTNPVTPCKQASSSSAIVRRILSRFPTSVWRRRRLVFSRV